MPRDEQIKSVLVIGSGPIVIGQAAEFDYSGTQACRVLRAEGVRVILVNSNPATIMTDPEFADATYIEPITPEVITTIIEKERPDAILPNLGGQTALNAAVALHESGVLERYGVKLIGASIDSIRAGEDRELFKQAVERCGVEVARSIIATSIEQCLQAADSLGYPMVVRPSYTMGGLGSGLARNETELRRIAGAGIQDSPTHEVLLEESLLGWKEIELEVLRDTKDHIVLVCTIDNVDPVGVHTGDSITIAPALSLSDEMIQTLRDQASAVIREIGVDHGGCNIQFAVHPESGRVVIIEMNPRVSRSSALASKATGYPIAKVTARLALGYTLDEIGNEETGASAADDPEIDYVVVKAPRFAFEKFSAADPTLTTTMKSVGEAMALGRNFTEALNKALRSIDYSGSDFDWHSPIPDATRTEQLVEESSWSTEDRLQKVVQALRGGASIEALYEATSIDRWFLGELSLLAQIAASITAAPALDAEILQLAKSHGFSDEQIAQIRGLSEATVRELRRSFGIEPSHKMVKTGAAEFEPSAPYHYSTYSGESEILPRERPAVIILGSGPNRIGQGVEFDYSCVHACMALSPHFETVMINCNPETVSTDYDTADRLYFEPLTFEDVMAVYEAEKALGPVAGVIVQLGGQTPLSLAPRLEAAGVPILGTSPSAINAAEDRGIFGALLDQAGLNAPAYGTASTTTEAISVAERIGYPVLARPSFVLGGRGMRIIYDAEQMRQYMDDAIEEKSISGALPAPMLIDHFLDEAVEIDVDAIFDGEELFLGGVMEHIEEAGIHSGDSSCMLPPATLSNQQIERIRQATFEIAKAVGVRGLINVQYALSSDILYVIEANPRASRTVPLVAKATGVPLAQAAALVMTGSSIAQLREKGVLPILDGTTVFPGMPIAVKEAVLPFRRFRSPDGQIVDNILGPEMRSTGEVMGLDITAPLAFAKSQTAAYGGLPKSGRVFISVADRHKRSLVFPASRLAGLGFEILATPGTADVLNRYGIPVEVLEHESNLDAGETKTGSIRISDMILSGDIDMVVNTPQGQGSRVAGYEIRTAATAADVALITTMQQFALAVLAIEASSGKPYSVSSLQEYDAKREMIRQEMTK